MSPFNPSVYLKLTKLCFQCKANTGLIKMLLAHTVRNTRGSMCSKIGFYSAGPIGNELEIKYSGMTVNFFS